MNYYVRPSSDVFVKYLFGRGQNKDLLIDFINAVPADVEFDVIIDVSIINPFNIKEFKSDKESILDIKAKDKKGRLYDIEVQTSGSEGFKNRSLFYWARLYAGQIEEGEPYSDLSPTICINMLDFVLFKGSHKNNFRIFLPVSRQLRPLLNRGILTVLENTPPVPLNRRDQI